MLVYHRVGMVNIASGLAHDGSVGSNCGLLRYERKQASLIFVLAENYINDHEAWQHGGGSMDLALNKHGSFLSKVVSSKS